MRYLALLLLLAAMTPARAQQQNPQPARPQIHGFVLEPDTNLPVAGAEITIFTQDAGPVLINGGWKLDESRKTATDVTGAFTVALKGFGRYRVQASKPGYGPVAGRSRDSAEVQLGKDYPNADVELLLGRAGELSGSVVDEATGKPIPNLQLRALRARTRGPRFFPGEGVELKTGADGQFEAAVPPGDYAVEIPPQAAANKRVLTKFTEKDLDATDLDYEDTYWPGGHDAAAALPVVVASGSAVNLGTLHARKVAHYRVHVRIPSSNCEAGDTMQVREVVVTPAGGELHGPSLAQAPCGKDILITGYSSGSYRLFLSIAGRTLENGGTAVVPFAITDRNIEITAPIMPAVTVDGVIVTADGAKPPDLEKLTFSLKTILGLGDTYERTTPGSDGRFRISGVPPMPQRVVLTGLDSAHYVKEIRYNGIPVADEIAPIDQPSADRALTIVVDDKVASITGTVTTGKGPASRPMVIAVRWPWDATAPAPGRLGRAVGDNTGKFQMTGLAPGEYRVVAIRSEQAQENLLGVTSQMFGRILETGAKVELSPGGFQNITVDLTEFTAQQLRP